VRARTAKWPSTLSTPAYRHQVGVSAEGVTSVLVVAHESYISAANAEIRRFTNSEWLAGTTVSVSTEGGPLPHQHQQHQRHQQDEEQEEAQWTTS